MDMSFLRTAKTIAVIGLSDIQDRPSYRVASYLQQHGYRIIPVNPHVRFVLHEPSFPSIQAIPTNIPIDIVDIFRKSEFVPDIVRSLLHRQEKPIIWMQEGVVSDEAKRLAESNNLPVVMNLCIMKEHQKLDP